MPVSLCAACKSRVEDGVVRCASCGATLYRPGAFMHVVGWITIAISLIPFSIAEVTTAERDWKPLIIGGAMAIAGIVLVVAGRSRMKASPPTVVQETAPAVPPSQP